MTYYLYKIVTLIYCLFFSTIVYYLSVDLIFPKISYNNVVEFDLAYLDQNERLLVFFKEKNARMHEVRTIEVPSSNQLNHYSLQVPYVYNPSFYLGFGENKKIAFALANLKINGLLVDINKIEEECHRIGLITQIKDHVVYSQPISNSHDDYFNVYNVSDNFINIEQEELNQYLNDENNLRLVFAIFILIVISYIGLKITRKISHYVIAISLFAHIGLLAISILLPQIESYGILSVNTAAIIAKNYLIILLVPTFMFIMSTLLNYKCIKFCLLSVSLFFMIVVGIDHFAQVVFNSRYFIDTTSKFATTVSDGLPFFLNYVKTYAGCYYILSLVAFIVTFTASFVNKLFIKPSFIYIFTLIFIISIGGNFFFNNNKYSRFYNVIQVNINGLFTDGDYKRDYNRYKRYTEDKLEYKSYKGLNQRNNVIVLLVESLGCNVTLLCGNSANYSKYTQQLARDNVWFPNYYSNNYHTNGALFTITTGLPLINGPHGGSTFFNKSLYTNDLINKFFAAGYETRYYTPASPVLNKKQQLEMSNYSSISTVNDTYYNGKEKKGVFNSVTDEEMFNKIINDLKSSSIPKFYMLTTISTHTPYITPWGANDVKQAFSYTDMVLKKFIEQLKDINYFDNGIVIITGDHIGWGIDNSAPNISSLMQSQQLPFILINGKEHGVIKSNVTFSHSSLGVMLEYLMLPEYKMNKFQINPIATDEQNEIILHYNANNANIVMLKKGDREDQILLDGDQTRFLGNKFSKDEQDEILGYISYVRQ